MQQIYDTLSKYAQSLKSHGQRRWKQIISKYKVTKKTVVKLPKNIFSYGTNIVIEQKK